MFRGGKTYFFVRTRKFVKFFVLPPPRLLQSAYHGFSPEARGKENSACSNLQVVSGTLGIFMSAAHILFNNSRMLSWSWSWAWHLACPRQHVHLAWAPWQQCVFSIDHSELDDRVAVHRHQKTWSTYPMSRYPTS